MYTKIVNLGKTKIYYYGNNTNYIISNGVNITDNSFFFTRAIIFPMSWTKKFGIDLKKI